jgi:hypothetical protein
VIADWSSALRRGPGLLVAWSRRQGVVYVSALALVILAGIVVRAVYLDGPMRYDEATTYDNYVSKPLYVSLANYSTPNNHLLNTALAAVSVTIGGNGPAAVRAPAFVAGVLVVVAAFAAAWLLYGRAAALLTAALVAGSSTLVEYSANARGYTLVALFTLTALAAAVRILERGGWGAWAALAGSGALGLFAVPVMVYPLGGILLWLGVLLHRQRTPAREVLRSLGACALAVGVLTALLYAPVFAASGVRSVTSNEFVSPRSWADFASALPRHAADTVEAWTRDLPLPVALLLAGGVLASLALTHRISRYAVPPLLAILAWSVPVLLVQRVVPFTRVWLFLVPLVLATGAGFYGWLLARPRTRIPLAELVSVVVAAAACTFVLVDDSVRSSRETGGLIDGPAVADYLAAEFRPGDRILATGSDTILQYYLARRGIDARDALFGTSRARREFVVVNVLGGQTLDDLVQADDSGFGPPRLLRSWRSAQVFLRTR